MKCVRVVIGRVGAHRRAFVLEKPPFPNVGDEITVKGDPKPWKVREVKETEYFDSITFPRAVKLKRTDPLA